MAQSLESLAAQALEQAKTAGAEAVDVVVASGISVEIDVQKGALEKAERSEATEIGLRVLIGARQAMISTSDTSAEAIANVAERVVEMARLSPEDPYIGLATAEQLAANRDSAALDQLDGQAPLTPGELQQMALEMEAAALDVQGVSQVQSASAAVSRSETVLMASNGFSAHRAKSFTQASCVAIAGEGLKMERDYDYDARCHRSDLMTADAIGRSAGARAAERLGARKPATGTFPVLFDERVASSLMGHLLQAVNGSSIARGSSWLRDALGEQILPTHLDLIEEPHRLRLGSSRLFDAEGLPTAERKIIDAGHLTGWTLDLATARQLGFESTANAGRGLTSAPSPGVTNIRLTQGAASRDDLLAEMGAGLLVTSMIGSTINPNTGDYSRGASGFWVENGEIAYPVNECTIASNLRDMLATITPANDAKEHESHVVPSLLVREMTIAGN